MTASSCSSSVSFRTAKLIQLEPRADNDFQFVRGRQRLLRHHGEGSRYHATALTAWEAFRVRSGYRATMARAARDLLIEVKPIRSAIRSPICRYSSRVAMRTGSAAPSEVAHYAKERLRDKERLRHTGGQAITNLASEQNHDAFAITGIGLRLE